MKEQQTAGGLWESNPTVYAVSPAKYHLPTASFIIVKKGQKATGVFLD
jgi:hypothetical protein